MSVDDLGNNGPPYWGDDRRHAPSRPDRAPHRGLLIGGGLLVAVFLGVHIVGGLTTLRTGLNTILLQMLLEAGAAALAVVVALLCMVRWRLAGEAAALWAGVAVLVYGAVTLVLTGLLPLVYGPAFDAAMWLRPASRLVAIAFLAAAVVSPPVDGRLRVGPLLVIAAALTGLLAVAFEALPGVAQHLTGAADGRRYIPSSGFGSALIIAAWAGLAVAFLVRGQRERRPLLAWLGLMLAGFGLAELTRVLSADNAGLWSAGAHVLRLTALGLGIAGATLELQRAFNHQSRDLMDSVVAAAAAEARVRAGRQEEEERAHEARNALAAIEGASQTLERYRDYLDADTRGSLVSAVSAEIARLQRLVSTDRLREDRVLFNVAEALAPVITGARAQGATLEVDIDDDVTAYGRWADTAEVVQNLLENARHYAPGSPVVVTARDEQGRALVRVKDRGPGVAPDQREAIFRRGVRGQGADGRVGSGLGLYVSARLMRDQHGDLWLEERDGGGAVFVVALPTGAHEPDSTISDAVVDGRGGPEGGAVALDEGDEPTQVIHRNRLPADSGNAGRRTVR